MFELEEVYPMNELKEWFLKEQRDLPWREDRSPYRVWVSEIMLQQTQVSVVIPYFHRWMKKFPTLASLATASLEEVIKLWEGLGYYSRARHLHRAARIIVEQNEGIIPSTEQELQALPGFGSYTVGAVLSFAFKQKAPAVDGNVVRVLSRYFASSQDCSKRAHYEELTQSVLPDEEAWITMEALIELGAQVCQKKPKCSQCPLIEKCLAYRQGKVLDFPIPRKRPPTIQLNRQVAIIQAESSILIRQEKDRKVMSGLYEFPYAPYGELLPFKIFLEKLHDFPIVKHGFTRYDVTLFPTLYKTDKKKPIEGYEWCEMKLLKELPFSSGHRRILGRILENLHAYFTY
ncbi:MAG: A/G-specific adenine glycosylase [Rhabdochlamydiaceae bacterium]